MASTDAVTRLLATVYQIVVNSIHPVLKSIQNITVMWSLRFPFFWSCVCHLHVVYCAKNETSEH